MTDANMYLSSKAKALRPSPTLAMANRARELQQKGHDVVSLTVGEPDWPTFEIPCKAGVEAIEKGFTKYTAAHGIVELRLEIAKHTTNEMGVTYAANDVVVGCGAKYILFAGMMMTLNPGDEVLIPSPYWVSYPTMVELAGGIPKIIKCEKDTNFKLSPELLENSITVKTKLLILCSPSNPTGLQYTKDELLRLAQVLIKHPQVFILSDDIYNQLLFSEEKIAPHLLHVAPELKDRILIVNGVSKTYSMTGWRVGWGLGPSKLIQPMADFLSQTTSSISSISQKASLAALQGCSSDIAVARKNLTQKMNKIYQAFKSISCFQVSKPDGAFYLWLDVNSCMGKTHKKSGTKLNDSKIISEILLNEHWVATVPGSEFGAEGYVRLSFATSDVNIEKAVKRFQDFSEELA